ncbi:hypothetical protein RFI_17668 [Reticulomyxa filosa]|uniref:Uncharacterized protein n=1 Tax=Reticulomyxa filosa TaxID=46433 RepID=X6N0G7_RETFI|nr:hypothetical protein RFI_17668 [Reticulomyxa filosa]|eukprot:ETO19561.1 hypothetical protein RFI_17668 [Reticulomyxa filosa]
MRGEKSYTIIYLFICLFLIPCIHDIRRVTTQPIENEEKEEQEAERKEEKTAKRTRNNSILASEDQMDHQRNLHALARLGIATTPVTRLSKYHVHDKFQLECAYAHLLSVSGKVIQATKLFMKWLRVINQYKLFPCNNPRAEWYFHHFYALHLHHKCDTLVQLNMVEQPLQKAYSHYQLALKYRTESIEDLFHFAQLCVLDEFKEYQKAKEMLTRAHEIDKRVYVIQHGYQPLMNLIQTKLSEKENKKEQKIAK